MVVPSSLIDSLRNAAYIAILTGAGISAESGIPTFRQAQTGLWAQYDPQELATPQAFRRNPGLVWRWYQWRRDLVARAAPNPGHLALAHMERMARRLTLITQNVDGLHQQAGSEHVVELHGNLNRNKCFSNEHAVASGEEVLAQESQEPPRCPRCHSPLRPDVVWFGESLPPAALDAAFAAAEDCDIFMTIGTSALVHPAASLPLVAIERRVLGIEINLQETPLSRRVDYVLRAAAGEYLPRLVQATWPTADTPGV